MRFSTFGIMAAAMFIFAACERSPTTLRVATPLLPVDQRIARDIVDMLDDQSGVRIEMAPPVVTEAEALAALQSGTADIALVSNAMPYHDGVATVMPMYPTVLHVAYREGRDASSGHTLINGARVFAGAEDSASRRMFERIAARLDLEETDFEYVNDPETQADVIVLFIPIAPAGISEHPELRLHGFGDPKDVGSGSVVDAAALLNPYLRPFVIPAGTYGDTNPEPVLTLAVDKYLVAREDLTPSVIYDLIEELLRLRPALAAMHPGVLGHLSDDFDITRSTFVLHEGTLDYLRREEPSIYERYSGIAEVVVTLLIGLISTTFAGVQILHRRRKNRIDRFYSAAIELRDSITHESSQSDRDAAITKVRDLQNDAFDQLVHEKLAADESFRIFITLSNDVLRQLGASGSEERQSDV
jgi:TRAP-type uncharacterized transport system substrate-binding protein